MVIWLYLLKLLFYYILDVPIKIAYFFSLVILLVPTLIFISLFTNSKLQEKQKILYKPF